MAFVYSFVSFLIVLIVLAVIVRAYVVGIQKRHIAQTERILANLSLAITKVTINAENENLHISTAANMIRTVHEAAIKRAKIELHEGI